MTDEELAEIERRVAEATPGPWYVRQLDDVHAMSLVGISTLPDTGLGERWPDWDCTELVAATLVQEPRYVGRDDGSWDANASFIAHARDDVPRLIAEVRRLRSLGQ
jgi:hypothetical protein